MSDADKKLADAYAGIFRAFVKHRDSVKMVTFWGVNDADSWRAHGKPLLFDGNSQPKPAFDAVIRAASGGQVQINPVMPMKMKLDPVLARRAPFVRHQRFGCARSELLHLPLLRSVEHGERWENGRDGSDRGQALSGPGGF